MGHADCCSNLLKTTRVCCSALWWKTRICIKICWYLQWQCNNHRGIPVYSWKKIIYICIGVDTSDIWGAVDLNLHIDSSRTVFRVMPAEKKCRLIRQWLINYTIKDTGGNRRLMRNLHNRGCLSGLPHRMNYGYVILKIQSMPGNDRRFKWQLYPIDTRQSMSSEWGISDYNLLGRLEWRGITTWYFITENVNLYAATETVDLYAATETVTLYGTT